MNEQLILIQNGEFIVCEDIVYRPAEGGAASLTVTTALPINTMKAVSVRLSGEMIPLPAIRTQDRKAVSQKIRIDGPIATRIAATVGLPAEPGE